jgi:1-phosphofructokinase
MITTLTMNPSIDRTSQVESLTPGAIHRIPPALIEAAGKGVNVSRGLLHQGVATIAVVACGSEAGRDYVNRLGDAGMDVRVVDTGRPVRCNITVLEADGRTTKLNEPGFAVSGETVEAALETVEALARKSDWVAASGSLPPEVPDTFYADLATRLATTGTKVAVDTSGPALAAMVGVDCALLKPNWSELASITDIELNTIADVVTAARRLIDGGTQAVLTSLGSDGAVLVTESSAVHAVAKVPDMSNTVGAGDSLLAGFLAGGAIGTEALIEGTAWARAALRSTSTEMARPDEDDRQAVVATTVALEGEVVDRDLWTRTLEDR